MAGYVTKGNNIYDGAHYAAERLENGMFAVIGDDGKVKKTTGAMDTVLRVAPEGKEDLWGMNALRLDVVSVGADEVFFVENEWEIDDTTEYNTAKYAVEADDPVKMKRLLPGEQILVSVSEDVFSGVDTGSRLQPGADGLVVLA